MADLSISLRIGSVFIIFAASACGVCLPFTVKVNEKQETTLFKCMKTCAAGIMLGIALMHLLPDADSVLAGIVPSYGLAFALTAAGIVLNLALEQIAFIWLAAKKKAKRNRNQQMEMKSAQIVPMQSTGRDMTKSISSKGKKIHVDSAKSLEMLEINVEHGEHCGFVKCEHGNGDLEESGGGGAMLDLNIPFAGVGHSHHAHNQSHSHTTVPRCEPRDEENDQPESEGSAGGRNTSIRLSNNRSDAAVNESSEQQQLEKDVDTSSSARGQMMVDIVTSAAAEETNSNKDEIELLDSLMEANGMRALITLYVMEMSISVHSIIIGVDMGMLSGRSQLPTLISLICAISFHQFVEGMGLGTILRSMRHATGNTKVVIFVLMFAMTTPIGIIIGICTSSLPQTNAQEAAKGVANSLAAGSLLFISLTEMVANYFTSPDLIGRPEVKLKMLAVFALGVTFMAVIAIWA